MKKYFDSDILGMIASVVCLIHCLFLPWILMVCGVWLGSYFTSPWFHHFMLVISLLIGIPIFLKSYLKYRSGAILFLGILGLTLTTYGTFMTGDTCCPPPSLAGAESCEESCETACAKTAALAKKEGCKSEECEEACASKKETLVSKEGCKSEECKEACAIKKETLVSKEGSKSEECKEACASKTQELATTKLTTQDQVEESDNAPELKEAGFNVVPIGVALLVLAHGMNFAHRKKCQKTCCDKENV